MPPRQVDAEGYPVEHWLDPEDVGDVEYAGYWNDEDAERAKEWNVADGNFDRMERYLDETGLLADLRASVAEAQRWRGRPIAGTGIDLAAGTLWAARHLLASGQVERLYCLEYSRHRLLKLGPAVLAHHGVDRQRVVLALGSFYELRLPDASLDFAFMSQALHHADDPGRLLTELGRVLAADGVVLVTGEHVVTPRMYALRAARLAASAMLPRSVQRRLLGHEIELRSRRLVPDPDPVMGDHFYSRREYARIFAQHGFTHRRVNGSRGAFQSFVLRRR